MVIEKTFVADIRMLANLVNTFFEELNSITTAGRAKEERVVNL